MTITFVIIKVQWYYNTIWYNENNLWVSYLIGMASIDSLNAIEDKVSAILSA